jgi:hypothetical protein
MNDKLPALHLYVQDYLSDTRSLSNETKGFYMDLLCYMHKSSRRGYLQQPNGNPYSPEQLGKMTGCPADEASRLLRDLLSSDVISATPKAVPYSRRMVRDEKKRVLCKRAGHLGGNPTLKGRVKGGGYPSPEDEDETLLSSDLGGDARGGKRALARAALPHIDPGNMMPAGKDPDNIQATRKLLKRFVKPTLEEVEAYCRERNNGIDPQGWLDAQDSRGWLVGKNKTPMADWKATIRTWESNRKERDAGQRQTESAPQPEFRFQEEQA